MIVGIVVSNPTARNTTGAASRAIPMSSVGEYTSFAQATGGKRRRASAPRSRDLQHVSEACDDCVP